MREYGITTSKADVWVHVCPLDACLYYYSRHRMLEVIPSCPEVEIASAVGRLVKLHGNRVCDGGFIRDVDPPVEWWRDYDFHGAKSDRSAGELAEKLFARCVREFVFQMPATFERYDDRQDQYQGKDFRVKPMFNPMEVEVKLDLPGGEWGSGNLFVQIRERNLQAKGRHVHKDAAAIQA